MLACAHVYVDLGEDICPKCGKDTHRTDWVKEASLRKRWYDEGKHLGSICPVEGGTIRGWWSI